MTHDISFSEPVREAESGIFFRQGCNTANPKARLLLLHGVGSNEANMASLAASLPAGIEILLLRGPLQIGPQGFACTRSTSPAMDRRSTRNKRNPAANFCSDSLKHFLRCQPLLPVSARAAS